MRTTPRVRNVVVAAAGIAGAILLYSHYQSAMAQEGTEPMARDQPSAEVLKSEAEVKTLTTTVTGIDRKQRTVTLKDDEGRTRTVDVPEEVKAFEQIKKGDQVEISYRESLALSLLEAGEAKPEMRTEEAMRRAEGDDPSGVAEKTVTISAEVVAVDTKNNTVTLRGPKGKVKEIAVQDPELQRKLQQVKPKEVIELAYTEATVVSLKPAKKK